MKNKESKNKKFVSKRIWISSLVIALFLQTMTLFIVWTRLDALSFQREIDNDHNIRQLIGEAARARFISGVTDPLSERVYIPELKIYVPFTIASRSLEYEYIEAHDGSKASASFSTTSVLGYPLNEASQNACTDLARIEFTGQAKPEDSESSAGQVRLRDGRILQVYTKKTSNCAAIWNSDSTPEVISKILLQAQSY